MPPTYRIKRFLTVFSWALTVLVAVGFLKERPLARAVAESTLCSDAPEMSQRGVCGVKKESPAHKPFRVHPCHRSILTP